MDTQVIRKPNQKDREYTDEEGQKVDKWLVGGQKDDRELFIEEIGRQRLKVGKDKDGIKLPFADKPAIDEYDDYLKEKEKTLKRMGYLPEEFKKLELDWKKYSDLKNFDLISEEDAPDTNLSNKNPGLQVNIKTKRYQYKGYQNIYICQEDGPSAIVRARKALKLLE